MNSYQLIKVSESVAARRRVYFSAYDATDGVTPETGITWAAGNVRVSKNGGAAANASANPVHVDEGQHYVELTATECNTVGTLTVTVQNAAMRPVSVAVNVVAFDPFVAGLGGADLTPTAQIAVSRIVERVSGIPFYATPAGGGTGTSPASGFTAEAAIAAATAGSTVMLMEGEHNPSANVSLADGVSLRGCGAGRTRLWRITSTINPLLSIGVNNVIEDVQIDNIGATSAGLGYPIGATPLTARRVYNSVVRRCLLRSEIDAVVFNNGAGAGRHKLIIEDTVFDCDWDAIAIAGTPIDLVLRRCTFFQRSQNARAVYIISAGGVPIRVYMHDCIAVRNTVATDAGGVIDVNGPDIEVRISNSILEADDVGGPDSHSIRAVNGAKVFLGPNVLLDRGRVSVASGGEVIDCGVDVSSVQGSPTLTPPSGPPAPDATVAEALAWLLARSRNKARVTADAVQVLDDADTVIAEFAIADDGTTLTQDKATAP